MNFAWQLMLKVLKRTTSDRQNGGNWSIRRRLAEIQKKNFKRKCVRIRNRLDEERIILDNLRWCQVQLQILKKTCAWVNKTKCRCRQRYIPGRNSSRALLILISVSAAVDSFSLTSSAVSLVTFKTSINDSSSTSEPSVDVSRYSRLSSSSFIFLLLVVTSSSSFVLSASSS